MAIYLVRPTQTDIIIETRDILLQLKIDGSDQVIRFISKNKQKDETTQATKIVENRTEKNSTFRRQM
jgi:hypothetical protein